MISIGKIAVDIAALQGNEKSIEQYISRLEALNSRLETLLGRIEASWEGEASRSYLNLMRGYAAQAANMVSVLQEFKSYVGKACSLFETKDKMAASRINSSF